MNQPIRISSAVAHASPASPESTVRPKPLGSASYAPLRAEIDVRDCPIEGRLPADLSGGFYATGPDCQYPPLAPGNILFDGEGHVRMFRIRNGRVDYRSSLCADRTLRGAGQGAPTADAHVS